MFVVAVAMGLLNSLGEPPNVGSDGPPRPDWNDIEGKLRPRLELSEMLARIDTPVAYQFLSFSGSQDFAAPPPELPLSTGAVTDITIRKPIRREQQFDWITPFTPLSQLPH